MGKWKHRLTLVDVEQQVAVCSECGPLTVWRSGTGFACPNRVRAKRGTRPHGEGRGTHGLTTSERAERLASQCAICGGDNDLVIDHDHDSMQIRGTLCRRCNVGLGMFRDKIEYLKAAISYLDA